MSAVGILAGAGPSQAGRHQMPYLYQASGVLAERWPAGLRTILSLVVGTLQKAANTRIATRWLDDYWGKSFPEKPQNLAVEEVRAILLRMLFDGFAQGAQPAVQEARLLSQDWGIPFEEVAYDKVQVWHGARDKNAPLQMMQWMTDRLPHSVLKVYENDTHFTMDQHLEAVLLALVPEKTKG
ncbi:hypothetical protein NUU61_004844 [Penicillium alfredii]|uniref:Uncharacterized protein n=1 Tax=Penicillium alfredii TaxID=1506179 RepID=A0A9W9K705_9EURO|nr:uncharacterized protein NUU61_004844 [Penicillium alfredii]KAJ5095488.1 hypothetical protein NUU61_004844 [Penicillium alfredii]